MVHAKPMTTVVAGTGAFPILVPSKNAQMLRIVTSLDPPALGFATPPAIAASVVRQTLSVSRVGTMWSDVSLASSLTWFALQTVLSIVIAGQNLLTCLPATIVAILRETNACPGTIKGPVKIPTPTANLVWWMTRPSVSSVGSTISSPILMENARPSAKQAIL